MLRLGVTTASNGRQAAVQKFNSKVQRQIANRSQSKNGKPVNRYAEPGLSGAEEFKSFGRKLDSTTVGILAIHRINSIHLGSARTDSLIPA